MSKLKIKCPNCKQSLSIPDNPGVANKMLKCPICHFRAKVSVFLQQNVGTVEQNDESDIPTDTNLNFNEDRTIGCLFYEEQGYPLHKGENTIGRKATTGKAEIQISEDRYMSRQHAVITVKEGRSGIEHHLQPANPKNPIKVNGKLIENADIVILQWGDHLTFGHTELIFERPDFYEEHTLIDE